MSFTPVSALKSVYIRTNTNTLVGTTIETANGEPIRGIRGINISLGLDDVNIAALELICPHFEGHVDADFVVADPVSGTVKKVRRIEFADGTVYPPDEAK